MPVNEPPTEPTFSVWNAFLTAAARHMPTTSETTSLCSAWPTQR